MAICWYCSFRCNTYSCGGGNGGSGNSDLKGKLKRDGSSTVAPIVEKLNEKWAQDHSDAKISAVMLAQVLVSKIH